jgi:hypothetical protein
VKTWAQDKAAFLMGAGIVFAVVGVCAVVGSAIRGAFFCS